MASAETFSGYAALAVKERLVPYSYTPKPLGPMEVEIRVTHNGLCHTDLHMRDNDWGNATYPLIAGHEVVGVVEKIGAHVTAHKPGDRVAFGWIRDSCRACNNCLKGEENICHEGYSGLILGGNAGGFQERMRAPADFAIRLPDGLDSADAAPLMCAGITVYNPLRTHITRPGMKVGVLAIGGLGHLAIQMAKAMGAEVTAFSTSPTKEEEARGFGAHRFVVYDPATPVGAGYSGPGLDHKVELLVNCSPALPPEGDFRNMMSLLTPDGTLVLTGIPHASMGKVSLLDLIFGQKKLAGSIVGGRFQLQEMLQFAAVHQIKPKLQIMKLSQINEAMDLVEANKVRYRIVLVPDSDFGSST